MTDDNYPSPQYEPEVDDDLWLTNDGRRLRVEEMTDLHLWNARQYLARQFHRSVFRTRDEIAHDKTWILRFEDELTRRASLGIRIDVRDGDS